MGTGLVRSQIISGTPGLLNVLDKTSFANGFAQFYGIGLGYKDAFVYQGSNFTLSFHVSSANGSALTNQAVTLQANKGYGGSTATFTSGVYTIPNTAGANDGADIGGVTDSAGNVSFSIKDTSLSAEPSGTSLTSLDQLTQQNGGIYGQFALKIGNIDQLHQSMDLVDIHVIATSSPTPTPSPTPSPSTNDVLLWSADFNDPAGTKPDSQVWTPLIGNGLAQLGFSNYGTGEIELNSADAAVADGNGNLVISTSKANGVWTSSRIWTQGKLSFQYGKIEARIKMPAGSFNWPAFWMLGSSYQPTNRLFGSVPWPNSGEIDIAEILQGNRVNQSTLHANNVGGNGDWNGGGGLTAASPTIDFSADFHTYGMLWGPNLFTFTVDGVEFVKDTYVNGQIFQSINRGPASFTNIVGDWPFNNKFFLILDNAIQAGTVAPDGSASQMSIDWIHYSTYNGLGTLSHS